MKTTILLRHEFLALFFQRKAEFMKRLHEPEVFVVRGFYPAAEILAMRKQVFAQGEKNEPSWHPLKDGCPDYHRLHDDYEKAYVKGRYHAYYHHYFYERNRPLFAYFREIFEMKAFLAGVDLDPLLQNLPHDGWVARVNFHHYPAGGGYQQEHIDPAGTFAQIQTLVQTSKVGEDFHSGGLYARKDLNSETYFIDRYTEPGDLMVLSPAIPHGVAPVDPGKPVNWSNPEGRWIILPIFVHADYARAENIKPRAVSL